MSLRVLYVDFFLVTRFILPMVMSTIAIFIQLYKTSHFKLYQRRFHFRPCVCSSNDIQCYDVGENNIGLSDIAGTKGKNTFLLCQWRKSSVGESRKLQLVTWSCHCFYSGVSNIRPVVSLQTAVLHIQTKTCAKGLLNLYYAQIWRDND